MIDNNAFADKIEGAIKQIFSDLTNKILQKVEYSILYNPKKHKTWFIVFFFNDMENFKTALEDGTCYGIHKSLLNFFELESKFEEIKKLISFEFGTRPLYMKENEELFDRLTNKLQSLLKTSGDKDQTTCASCGHNFDNHQLRFIQLDDNKTPFEGWMTCPEENCTCFSTWSANYDATSKE